MVTRSWPVLVGDNGTRNEICEELPEAGVVPRSGDRGCRKPLVSAEPARSFALNHSRMLPMQISPVSMGAAALHVSNAS